MATNKGGSGGTSTSSGGSDSHGNGGAKADAGGAGASGAGTTGGDKGGAEGGDSNLGGSGGTGGLVPAAGAGGDVGSGATGGQATGGSGSFGIIDFQTFAFYRPVLVASPDNALHLVFTINDSPSSVYYARCAADCGVGANWQGTIIDTAEFSGSARMVTDSANRLHLLYETGALGGSSGLIYATCASNCTDASRWTKTNLASLFGGGWTAPTHGTPLVIDAQGRLSFTVDRKIYLNGGLTLATCASGCSNLSNWSAGTIMPGVGTRTSLAARGTTLHQLVDNDTTDSSDPTALSYRTCSANCTQAASWQELPNMFVYDGDKSTQIAVTEQGQVRIVYNQGQSPANQPAAVQAQNQKMLFWGCDANCLQAASWKGFVMGAEGDGAEGIQMVEQGGALVLSITNTSAVRTRFCTSDCLVDSNWQEAVVDSTAPLYDQLNPLDLVSSTCGIGLKPVNATWHVAHGVVAIRPDGALAFAHSTHILRTCPNSSAVTYFPGYGRLVFVE